MKLKKMFTSVIAISHTCFIHWVTIIVTISTVIVCISCFITVGIAWSTSVTIVITIWIAVIVSFMVFMEQTKKNLMLFSSKEIKKSFYLLPVIICGIFVTIFRLVVPIFVFITSSTWVSLITSITWTIITGCIISLTTSVTSIIAWTVIP